MSAGRLESINVSAEGGVPKRPVARAAIGPGGVEGDRQRDRRYHGGPERAVSLFSAELIAALAAEGHPIAAGTTGENLTLSGVRWSDLAPGAEVRVGPVRLVVTSYARPCGKIGPSFSDGRPERIAEERHPGWSRVYARVLEAGVVSVGDAVTVVAPRR